MGGRPQRAAATPDLTAAHRVTAGACEARARALEGSCGAPAAAAAAACIVHEGAACRWQWCPDDAPECACIAVSVRPIQDASAQILRAHLPVSSGTGVLDLHVADAVVSLP